MHESLLRWTQRRHRMENDSLDRRGYVGDGSAVWRGCNVNPF